MTDSSNPHNLGTKASFAAAMLQGVAATLHKGEIPDLAQMEAAVVAVADALAVIADEARRRASVKPVEAADLGQPAFTPDPFGPKEEDQVEGDQEDYSSRMQKRIDSLGDKGADA